MPSEMVFLLVDEVLTSRILIISHVPEPSRKLEGFLLHEGFESISLVESVSEAIFFLKPFLSEESLPVDLIIFEGGSCSDDCIEEIWCAKESFEMLDIPLVITGDFKMSDDLIELIETGCVDFIPKPFSPINLVARLKTLLNLRQTNRKLKKHQNELQELTRELEEKNRKLNSILEDIRFDLQMAGDLQRSFLPSEKLECETADFAFFYQPCETIGGDLINVVPVSSRSFVLYLLDVSGHGVSAALSAFAIHRYLSSEWNHSLIKKANGKVRCPVDVLKILNRDFLMHNEWFKYFTITYGIYDSRTRTLRYCRAGQTPLLLIRGDGSSEFVNHGCPPVGVSESARFVENKIQLYPGDRVFLYSDGIVEAKKADGSFFGEERLFDELNKMSGEGLKTQLNSFTKKFFKWLGDESPRDDIALLSMMIK